MDFVIVCWGKVFYGNELEYVGYFSTKIYLEIKKKKIQANDFKNVSLCLSFSICPSLFFQGLEKYDNMLRFCFNLA